MIPNISTIAGSTLTARNWKEALITTIACSFEQLLCKPGIDVLKKMPTLHDYLGFDEAIILNAASLKLNQGYFELKSPFDGQIIRLSTTEALDVILNLQPNAVLLPPGFLSANPQAKDLLLARGITLFRSHFEWENCEVTYPYYQFDLDEVSLSSSTKIPANSYIFGEIDLCTMEQLVLIGICNIESNWFSKIGYLGQVISKQGLLNLLDPEYELDFVKIEDGCDCPTCQSDYTRAYLRHLFLHTPLLCQRFLIQHNIFYCQKIFSEYLCTVKS